MPLKHYPLIDFTLESKIKLNNLSLLKALKTIFTLDVKSRFVFCIYKIKTPFISVLVWPPSFKGITPKQFLLLLFLRTIQLNALLQCMTNGTSTMINIPTTRLTSMTVILIFLHLICFRRSLLFFWNTVACSFN